VRTDALLCILLSLAWSLPTLFYMQTILLIILVLLLLGALPVFPYSSSWGYYPSGGLGLVILILVLVALFR
jgi:hypothetical protein